ncbi:MAG: 2Fe-2S iron-sulfur cluster-binding protein [Alphaproteobacteria bacterium]
MTANGWRLPAPAGRLLDRSRQVAFSFEGRRYEGFAGDTIASALAANGQWLLSRSFKYHRPRGVLTMAGQDANTLVQLKEEPNVLADRREIGPGLEVWGQNYTGSLERDRDSWIGRFGSFLPVGFYYKAFYKPKGAWRYWEPIIRRRAGLGRVNLDAAPGYYDKAYGWSDVAVIGGGPAGMSAALEAAGAGAEVILIEEGPILGGALNYARPAADGNRAASLRDELVAAVEAEPNIQVLTSAICQAWFTDSWLPCVRGNRLHKLRAREVVVATGSIEQPVVFRNNDMPGVMLGSAAQRLIRLYGVRPGRRAVVVTANGDGYGVALDLVEAGVEVAAAVDLRPDPPVCERIEAVRGHGVDVIPGHTVWEGVAGPDKRHVAGVRVARITGEGECADGDRAIDCDLICMATGYAPTAQLLYHAQGKLAYDDQTAMFTVKKLPPHLHAAGSVNSAFYLDAGVAGGRHAGWAAARGLGLRVGAEPRLPNDRGALGQSHPWPIFPHPRGKDFVDFDEDLQVKDILNTIADGYDHIELLKRYSTAGMGPSQGRHSALTTVRLAAKATGRPVGEVGTTTSRPPFAAEKMGVLAGRSFYPVRTTAMHARHLEAGAQMMVAGPWLRPAYYGPPEARAQAIREEVMSVRDNVGLIDVSTLGGLEVRGPDAAEFLNRVYTFAYLKQQVGRARYVLMTNEAGAIADDGVACRFHDHHFYVTATTGGAEAVYRIMLWYNAQWRLDVDITDVTAAYSAVNIAGPRSREVLERLSDDVDLSAEGFPYMGIRTGTVAAIPARLLRVGFVGELGYELHAPASQGEALWDALMEAGRDLGIRPFGIVAQRILRLEKGHIIIGQDTDDLTHPYEADMAWAISRKKPFFVGRRAIDIQMEHGLERKLVGFTIPDPAAPVPDECHLVVRGADILGRVTSVAASPILGKTIGLAYVAPEQAEPGQVFDIKIAGGRLVQAEVAALPFYDPDNERQEL